MRDFANSQLQALLLGFAGRAGLAMLFAALLAFLAPFGTYQFEGFQLVGYWTFQMIAWLLLSIVAAWLVGRVPVLRSGSVALRRALTILVASLPMLVVVGVANNMMSGWQPYPGEVIELLISIWLIGGSFTILSEVLTAGAAAPQAGAPQQPAASPPDIEEQTDLAPAADAPLNSSLIDRLPAHIRVDIICLQVEDHYVRVHSRQGSAMVLMRFSDALRGLDHIKGSQVHRSWWVADDAVTGLRRIGRTAQLTLTNGASVPVSQPYLAHAIGAWGAMEASTA